MPVSKNNRKGRKRKLVNRRNALKAKRAKRRSQMEEMVAYLKEQTMLNLKKKTTDEPG